MPVLIGVGVLLLIVLSINGFHELKERRRRGRLRKQAELMGYSFNEAGEARLLELPADFLLFAQGMPVAPRNALRRPWAPPAEDGQLAPELSIFEYTFNVRFGRYLQSWRQTVVRLQAEGMSLPTFSVMPQRVFDALATRARDPELREKVLGTAQIKLPAYPTFTERIHIHGYDRLAVQSLFGDDLVAIFDNDALLCLEASGSMLVLYTFDKVAKAEELPALAEHAMRVFALLQPRAAVAPQEEINER